VRVVITLSVVAAVIALIAAVVFLYVRWYVLQPGCETASGRGRSGELGPFDNPLAHPISSVPGGVYQLHSVKSEADKFFMGEPSQPTLTPTSKGGTQFTYPGRMEG